MVWPIFFLCMDHHRMNSNEKSVGFEVNISIIAARTSIMKPFFRYIIARITGKDLHAVLRWSTEQRSFNSSWISRLWPSRPTPDKSQPGPKNIIRPAVPNDTKNVYHTTDIMLNLPLQGGNDSEYIDSPLKQETSDSLGSLQTTYIKSIVRSSMTWKSVQKVNLAGGKSPSFSS